MKQHLTVSLPCEDLTTATSKISHAIDACCESSLGARPSNMQEILRVALRRVGRLVIRVRFERRNTLRGDCMSVVLGVCIVLMPVALLNTAGGPTSDAAVTSLNVVLANGS